MIVHIDRQNTTNCAVKGEIWCMWLQQLPLRFPAVRQRFMCSQLHIIGIRMGGPTTPELVRTDEIRESRAIRSVVILPQVFHPKFRKGPPILFDRWWAVQGPVDSACMSSRGALKSPCRPWFNGRIFDYGTPSARRQSLPRRQDLCDRQRSVRRPAASRPARAGRARRRENRGLSARSARGPGAR